MATKKKKKYTTDFVIEGGAVRANKDRVSTTIDTDFVVEDGVVKANRERAVNNLRQREEDLAPIRTVTKSNEERSWFEKGLFEDGYDIGDITRSILGTVADFPLAIERGIGTLSEGAGNFIVGSVAKGADYIGKDELADDIRNKLAGKDEEFNKRKEQFGAEETYRRKREFLGIDESSFLGEKSTDLISSGGQLLGAFAVGGGVGSNILMGVSAAGNELENAYKSGATDEEAWLSAGVTGVSEFVFEKISRGIKFGGKTLDSLWTEPLTKKITNKTANVLANLGLDAAGEGFEEVLTEAVQSLGRLSYEHDKTWEEALWSEEARDNYIESFIGGAVLGGAFNAPKTHMSIKTGRDYNTGLTEGEQSVIDTVINERTSERQKQLAEQQKNEKLEAEIARVIEEETNERGELTEAKKQALIEDVKSRVEDIDYNSIKLSNKELKAIREQVNEDLERGEIDTFTIENTLFQDTALRMRELNREIQTADDTRKAEIQAELDQLQGEFNNTLASNGKLLESYRQNELRKQPFEREVTDKDSEKAKAIIERAKELGLDNTRRSHEKVDLFIKIAEDSGYDVIFTNNEELERKGDYSDEKTAEIKQLKLELKNESNDAKKAEIQKKIDQLKADRNIIDGFVTPTGKLILNVDSPKYIETTVGHELSHILESTKSYKAYKELIKEYAVTKGVYDDLKASVADRYKNVTKDVEGEVTASLTGDYIFNDQEFVNKLSAEQPNIFKQAYDYIKHVYKMATAGSKEARQLERAKRMFEKAYREMGKTIAGKTDSKSDSNSKYSLEDIANMDSKAYNKHGWAKVNDVLSDRELADFMNKVGVKKRQNNHWYLDLENGKHMFAVGVDGINNTLIISDGNFNNPTIEKVYHIYADNETDIEDLRRYIYEETRANTLSSEIIELYFGNELVTEHQKGDFENYRELRREYEREQSKGTLGENSGVQNGKRSNSETTTKYSIGEKAPNEGVFFDGEKTKFSLSSPVEETKDLLVLHNTYENKLLKQLKLEGFPMPSLAVTNQPHSNFGPISIIFDKDTIDPKKNKKNKTYSADAWTPMVPRTDYEVDSNVERNFKQSLKSFIDDSYYETELNRRFYNSEDMLKANDGYEGYIADLSNRPEIQYAFLKSKGEDVKIAQREKEVKLGFNTTEKRIALYEKLINGYPGELSELGKIPFKELLEMDLIKDILSNTPYKNGHRDRQINFLTKFFDQAKAYQQYDPNAPAEVEYVDDYPATDKEMAQRVDLEEVKEWLRGLSAGIVKSEGIYNGKDVFTPSGGRRSFKQLHYPVTAANIVKAMQSQGEKSVTSFNGVKTLRATTAKTFKSIDEIRKSKDRIQPLTEEETKIIHEELSSKMYEVFNKIIDENPNRFRKDDIFVMDHIGEIFSEAGENINASYIKGLFNKYGYEMSSETADDSFRILDAISAMPVNIFEAKPQRVVGYDEIKAVLIPEDSSEALKNALKNRGINFIEYDGTEADRQAKVNNAANEQSLRFSLSKQHIAPVNKKGTLWSDIMLQKEDIAPVKETISETETVAKNATTEDIAPVREDLQLSRALTEEDLPYVEQDRADAFDNLPVYEPEEIEYYNEPDTAPLDDKYLRLVAKNMRQELGLKNNQVAGLRKIIQDFSTSEDQSMESLHDAIEAEFGTIYEKQKIDDITGIKAALRSTRLKVSDVIKTDIPDYAKWKQKQFGTLRIANDGMAVDDVYEGLKDIYPQYFPDDIINPTDQLLKIAEIASMDATVIEEYSLPEEQIQEVTDYIYESISEYKQQKRFEAAQTAGKAPIDESMIPYEETILETPIPEDVAPVKKEEEPEAEPETVVEKTKKELRKHLIEDDAGFLIKALDKAKNIPMALMNNTDTIRVTEMVFGRAAGKKINDLIFQKAINNEARSIAWQNKQRAEIAALGIKARSKESEAVQKYAEKKILTDEGEYITYDDATLERDFKDPEQRARIIGAARALREKYDTYIDIANNVLTDLGFDPIPKRDDYMRHFQELNDVFTRYGIPFNAQNMSEHVLPTDINGLTEFWSPQKNFFANIQPRKGMRTTFDAITGIDGYISGISNLIFHTEDIQRGRALEDLVRETYGETSGWENLEKLPEEEQAARAEQIQDNHLSNYAAWLHEWTNNMAGKKNKIDRSIESMFGRRAFSFLDETRKQVGSNMIGLNLSSSLTNLIAPVQAMAKTNKLAVAKGTADTIKNIFVKDNFMENNSFLTSRMGTDMLSKTAWEKMRDAGFVFMKGMDWFSSNQIVRSKFYELKAQGKTDIEAHAEAGKFAARIMGDRTKGANAQLYNSKLVGLVTQFQLEVNNQLYSMFYDTYHESKENADKNALKTAAGMTFTLGQLFAFTHLFGKTFESIAGYNPTFDVIGILATALGTGDDEEDKPVSERLKDAADKLVDALPYVNILTGGGRIPVTSGIPNLVGVATGGKDDYGNELTWEGELKKLTYLVPPTGGGQIKKTVQGLGMFDDDLPVTGSYTDSGNLRFPVEDTPLNRLQAGIFGQWSNENARDYFDNERKPLGSKQIQEYKDLDIPIADYWKYREDLKDQKTLENKFDYIADLDLPVSKKNIMINNIVDRKEAVDMTNYDQFESFEEFDWATKNPEKYSFLESIGVSYKQYNASDEAKEAYNWAYKNPEKYSLARAAAGDVVTYRSYVSTLNDITADKYSNGKTISGSRKKKVADYISSLDADYGSKLVLFKSEYPADDTYNYEIIEYLNNRQDISYDEMVTILRELDFTVGADGYVTW